MRWRWMNAVIEAITRYNTVSPDSPQYRFTLHLRSLFVAGARDALKLLNCSGVIMLGK